MSDEQQIAERLAKAAHAAEVNDPEATWHAADYEIVEMVKVALLDAGLREAVEALEFYSEYGSRGLNPACRALAALKGDKS